MNDRIQKKCVLASFGVHSLLCVLLLVGPTFLRSKEVVDSSPILEFIPIKTTDDLIQGGGDPKGATPAPEPPRPLPPQPKPPEPKPEPVVKPEPKEAARKVEPEVLQKESAVKQPVNPDALEPIESKPKVPDVSTKLVIRNDNQAAEKKKRADQAARAEVKRIADANKRMADTINKVANNLSNGLSTSTIITLNGPGGGGVPYANFLQAVKSVYTREWNVPEGVTDEQATATATVLIARNGDVVNFRIINLSRNSEVDRSVQATLERVKWAAPLPENATENQREVTIRFNVKARRAIG